MMASVESSQLGALQEYECTASCYDPIFTLRLFQQGLLKADWEQHDRL